MFAGLSAADTPATGCINNGMPSLPFVTLDVFTRTRYLGNPLAVVRIPADASSLPPTKEQKQAIAREFNLAETVFLDENIIYTQHQGDEEEMVGLDIFTPEGELPFAGHPTVGASYYLFTLRQGGDSKRSLALLTKAGRVPVKSLTGGYAVLEVPHEIHLHRERMSVTNDLAGLFPTLSPCDYLPPNCGIPVFSIVKGMTFALCRLTSLEALARVTQSPQRPTPILDAPWDTGLVGALFYVVTNCQRSGDSEVWKLRTRVILGLVEDAATGSASCAVSVYLAQNEHAVSIAADCTLPLKHSFQLTQGVEMGRTSDIGIEVVLKPGGIEVESVGMSGTAVKVMEGTLEY